MSDKPVRAMILAAGRGERLRPLTDTTPKALMQVGGECLIDRHLQRLSTAGVELVVINLGWLGEQIMQHVSDGRQHGLRVVYSNEYEHALETGGGIRCALPMLGNDWFWVVNGDIYTDLDLTREPLSEAVDGELILVDTPAYKAHGDFGLDKGLVTNGSDRPLTFSGIARYRSDLFFDQPMEHFALTPLLRETAEQKRLAGRHYSGQWEDIGTEERLNALNEQLTAQ